MSKKMTKLLVLTSRENFVWHSMQEIIPYIESTWQNLNSAETTVEVINVDSMTLSNLTPKLISADKLIVTCFNYRLCKILQYIREILRLNLGFVIHVHNLSTIAFWPYRYFTTSELFVKTDVFITSCTNDKATLENIFIKPLVYVVPFFMMNTKVSTYKKTYSAAQNIVYVGRISPQKNLHNLILAYSFLKNESSQALPPLILFGKEDHLGCPNMNFRNDDYLNFLKNLCLTLNVATDVYFKGHVDRQLIEDFLNEKSNLFISPSLHSDENFGMAALQSILSLNKTLLSDWGGHSDFKTYFDNSVELIPVTLSEYGPALSARVIATALDLNLQEPDTDIHFKIDSYYTKSYYEKEYLHATHHQYLPVPLRFSELANVIYEAKLDYTTSATQIFSGFNDFHFHEISKTYIGKMLPSVFQTDQKEFLAVPWMNFVENAFEVLDPHKGKILIPDGQGSNKKYKIYFNNKSFVFVTQETCERLFKNAFINYLS